MAERVVKVTVTAMVNSYLSGMDQVAKKARENRTEAEALTARLEAQRKAIDYTGKAMLVGGGLIAAGLALAVNKAAEFDQAMSNVEAATNESAANMSKLRDAAIEAGASTVFTAKQSANAIEELAKAGVSTKDILGGGLTGALSLAAAGQLEVADAAQIAAVATKQFNLAGSDVPHVADLLAAGAGKAVGDVTDLAQALAQAGLVANGAGQSIEDTTGVLSAFADAGLIGSDAGTSLKSAIIALQAPTQKSMDVMDQYGLSFYDGSGKMLSFTQIAGQLQSKLSGLTDEQRNSALATIFGTDALRSANVLYTQGAAGIQKYIDQTNDAGYANEQARKRLYNLRGDLEKLGGAWDTALIKVGESGQASLRAVVQGITEVVDGFGNLPEGAQTAVYWTGLVTAAIALSGGTFLTAVPKVAAFKEALDITGLSLKSVAFAAGGTALALGGVFAIVTTLAQAQAEARARAEQYADAIAQGQDAAKKFIAEQLAMKDSFLWIDRGSAVENARKLGISIDDVTRAVTGSSAEFDNFKQKVQEAYNAKGQGVEFGYAMQQLTEKVGQLRDAQSDAAKNTQDTADAQDALTDATGKSTGEVKTAAQAYKDQADKVDGVRRALTDLIDQIDSQNSIQQKAVQANATWLDGLKGIAEGAKQQRDEYEKLHGSLDGFVLSLDQATASGSANASMFAGLAQDAADAAQAQYEVDQTTMGADASTQKYADTLAAQRQAFIDSAEQAGYNKDEVKKLADQIFALPDEKKINFLAETAGFNAAVDALIKNTESRQARVQVLLEAKASDQELAGVVGIGVGRRAMGGPIYGPGPRGVDSVPILAAPGEHVLTVSDVDAMGGQAGVYRFRAALHDGLLHRAAGGAVPGGVTAFTPRPQYSSQTVVVRPSTTPAADRPIVMDGKLFGVLRELANGEARIVLNEADARDSRTIARGRQLR